MNPAVSNRLPKVGLEVQPNFLGQINSPAEWVKVAQVWVSPLFTQHMGYIWVTFQPSSFKSVCKGVRSLDIWFS